jgi:hypothetical protein
MANNTPPQLPDPSVIEKFFDEIIKLIRLLVNLLISLSKAPWRKKWVIIFSLALGAMFVLQFDLLSRFGVLLKEKVANYLVWGWVATGILFIITLIQEYRILYQESKTKPPEYKKKSPVKGLWAFNFDDREIFKKLQRTTEVEQIRDDILNNNYHIGVLQGVSGSGKTSFLRAGLFGELNNDEYRCLIVTLSNEEPVASVKKAIKEKEQLELDTVAQTNLSDVLDEVLAKLNGKKLILIFDQFEQFFTQKRLETERKPFIGMLDTVYKSLHNVKILLSIRTDYVGNLHEIQKEIKYTLSISNAFQIKKFTLEQVTAILKVIAEAEQIEIDEDFVKKMVPEELASKEDGLISAVDIQILALTIKGLPATERGFNKKAFLKIGGIEGLLQRYLQNLLELSNDFNQNKEAISILLALIDTHNNTRAGWKTLFEIEEILAGTVSNELITKNVDWLSENRLLNKQAHLTTYQYALAHERLIGPIRSIANRSLEPLERAAMILEKRTNEWLGSERASRYLLGWNEYRVVQRNWKNIKGINENPKKEFLDATKRKFRFRQAALGVIVLLVVSISIFLQTNYYKLNWEIKNNIREITDKNISMNFYNIKTKGLLLGKLAAIDSVTNTETDLALQMITDLNENIETDGYYLFSKKILTQDSTNTKIIKTVADNIEKIANENKSEIYIYLTEGVIKLNDPERAKIYLDSAFRNASKIIKESVKSKVYISLIENATKLNQADKGNQYLDSAVNSKSKNKKIKAELYSSLAENYSKLNQLDKVKQYLDSAFRSAEKIFDTDAQYDIYISLAKSAAKLNQPEILKKLIKSDVKRESFKPKIYVFLAENYSKLNQLDKVKQYLDSAFRSANELTNEFLKFEFYISLAESATKLNQSKSAKIYLDSAFRSAKKLMRKDSKGDFEIYFYESFAKSFAKVGQLESGKIYLDSAFRSTQKLNKGAYTYKHLAEIAIKLNYPERAKICLDSAFRSTEKLINEYDQVEIYSSLAELSLTLNNKEDIKEFLEKFKTLGTVFKKNGIDHIYKSALASLYVYLVEFREAYDITSEIDNTEPVKVLTYIHILDAYQKREASAKKTK